MRFRNVIRRLIGRPEPEPEHTGTPDIAAISLLLSRAIRGETITREERDATTWVASGELDQLAQQAWMNLGFWISDDDIRGRDAEYAQRTRAYLEWLLEELEKGVSENRL